MAASNLDQVIPRLYKLEQVAAYMGLSKIAFSKLLPKLREGGFPNALSYIGRWDRKLIDAWLDRMSGLSSGPIGFYPTEPSKIGNRIVPIKATARKPPKERCGSTYTVGDAIRDYLEWFRDHRKSFRSTKYTCDAYIVPHFGHRVAEDLESPEIRAWHQALSNSPRARHVAYGKPRKYMPPPATDEEKRRRRNTANRTLMVMRAALNMAVRDGKITNDTAWRSVQAFRGVVLEKADYLTVDECRKLAAVVSPDFRNLMRAALYTGARLMELARMTAADFNPEAGTVQFMRTKTSKGRHVSLTEEGSAFFQQITYNVFRTDIVLRRSDGDPWRPADPCYRLKTACQVACVKHISFHAFRHTYASLLAMSGASSLVIAKNLGHSSTDSSERYYSHLSPEYLGAEVRTRMPDLQLDRFEFAPSIAVPQTA